MHFAERVLIASEAGSGSMYLEFKESDGENDIEKCAGHFGPQHYMSFTSGVVFEAGTSVLLYNPGQTQTFTLLGYVPGSTSEPSVPSISNAGLGMMALTILGAGGLVMRRQKAAG